MHWIGVDVSKHKLHAGWLVDAAGEKIKPKAVANSPADVDTLLAWVDFPRHRGHVHAASFPKAAGA